MVLPAPTCLVVTTTQRKTGIARDAVVNTWHYGAPDAADAADFTAWGAIYRNFVNNIKDSFSNVLSSLTNDVKIEFWYIPINGKGPLGAPAATIFITHPATSNTVPLPSEVAICLTLEAHIVGIPEQGPGGTRPASRRRNRKYLGPLDASVLFHDPTTYEPEIPVGIRDSIAASYQNEMVNGMRAAGWSPVCFSRSDWTTHPVERVWVDNAFDTQRRRGQDATVKSSRPV